MYATVVFGGEAVSGEQMSGHVMLNGGRGLLAPAASAVGLPSVFHMPHAIHVSVTGSRLKSTKLPELYHIVPADSVPTPPLPVM